MTVNTQQKESLLDVTRETCPMTFVRTRLALERLSAGDLLRVLVKGDEPRDSVPRMAEAQGHTVLAKTASVADPAILEILIRRGARA
ncbi:sulfurtransferase TusA family protein [Acidisoma sp.]|uniref:sulfurtransferase TusA family protein n=1 Tax=Acidisoma sp. TaxID=1872115 RepID=UPI003B0002CE